MPQKRHSCRLYMWVLGQSFGGEMNEKGSAVYTGLWLKLISARMTRGLFLLVQWKKPAGRTSL